MTTESPDPIGDAFWLQQARGMVVAIGEKLDAAVDRVSAAVAWLATLYTAVVTLGASALAQRPPIVGVLLATPIVLLVTAYGVAVWARQPIEVQFDPRVPSEIESVYYGAARRRSIRLRWTGALAVLAALCIASGIVVSALVGDDAKTTLTADALRGQGRTDIVASVTAPDSTAVTFSVANAETPGDLLDERLVVADGHQVSVHMDVPDAAGYVVSVRWSDQGVTHILQVEVSPHP